MYRLVWVGYLYTDVDLSEWMSMLRYGREPSVEGCSMVYCRSCVRELRCWRNSSACCLQVNCPNPSSTKCL